MKWSWQKLNANYRTVADELAQATALVYRHDDKHSTPFDVQSIIKKLVYLDCFLFERIVNQLLPEKIRAEKLVNAFSIALIRRPEVNLTTEKFQNNYDLYWDKFEAAWRAEQDLTFAPSLGIKMPLAATFVAECGEYSLSTLTYVSAHISATRKHLPEILRPLLAQNKLSFD